MNPKTIGLIQSPALLFDKNNTPELACSASLPALGSMRSSFLSSTCMGWSNLGHSTKVRNTEVRTQGSGSSEFRKGFSRAKPMK